MQTDTMAGNTEESNGKPSKEQATYGKISNKRKDKK